MTRITEITARDLTAGERATAALGLLYGGAGPAPDLAAGEQAALALAPAGGRRRAVVGHRCGERGEGVISAAIAVLIVAFLGAAMWVAFDAIWTDAESNIKTQVGNIGS